MTEKIITTPFKTNAVDQVIESITEPANTLYYLFVGNHISYDDGDTLIPTPNNSFEAISYEPYKDMIFGKQINGDDITHMIKRYDWQANTIYTMYDHRDGDLFSKQFYIVTNEASQYHVFKCLYNAANTPSVVQPSYADVAQEANLFSNSDTYYQTSDGYQWKYMYSVTDTVFNKFATDKYMPLIEDPDVISLSTDGSIDVVKVDVGGGGQRFDNYISNTFTAADLRLGGNTLLYHIAAPAAAVGGYYTNCIIHIVSGPATGQYRKIVDYEIAGSYIVLESEFPRDNTPQDTSVYEISPEVVIVGDGQETVNAVARALISANSANSVYEVEILEKGAGYREAVATIMPQVTGNTSALSLTPIISPPGGHGADPKNELGASYLGISVTFANSEANTITTENDFRQVGIIRDPLFANVEIEFVKASDPIKIGSDGVFSDNELFYQFKKGRLYGSATSSSTSAVIDAEGDEDWSEGINVNDWIFLWSTDKLYSFISQVVQSNSSTITLSSNVPFTTTALEVYSANIIAEGYVNDQSTGQFYSQNTSGFLVANELIIGSSSYAMANVSNVAINSVSKTGGFEVFSQLRYFEGSVTGTFNENETLTQEAPDYPVGGPFLAKVHSVDTSANTARLYFTRKWRNVIDSVLFTNGTIITVPLAVTGVDSTAEFAITKEYAGDIVPNSGDIIYLQNGAAVTRSANTSETIKIISEF